MNSQCFHITQITHSTYRNLCKHIRRCGHISRSSGTIKSYNDFMLCVILVQLIGDIKFSSVTRMGFNKLRIISNLLL